MTDYKKRIEARQEDIAEIVTGHFPNASRKVLQEITDEFNELLHQVEAETEVNLLQDLEQIALKTKETSALDFIVRHLSTKRIELHREES